MPADWKAAHHACPHSRTHTGPSSVAAAGRRSTRVRFSLVFLLMGLLGLPGTIWAEELALDLPTAPVHVAVASMDSAAMTVDLSDPTKYPFSGTGKWTGYLEFLGKPGTERSLGQPDLFLPILQDPNDMTFFNLRGQLQFDNTDVHEYNIGLGHRHMFKDWILGGYGYFDQRHTQFGSAYSQFTGGLEAMSVDWAFRMNGYLPENKTETIMSGANVSVIRPGDQIKVQVDGLVQEKALPGVDGEVGYLLPIPWKDTYELRVYAGGYHFFGEDQFESVTGPRGRLEWRSYDLPVLGPGSRFMMGVEAQWDEPRGSQAFGLASLRIPFDVFSDKSERTQLTGLDRRMLQPVIRDVDVVTSEFDVVEVTDALNPAGKAYTKARDVTLDQYNQAIETDEDDGEVIAYFINNGGGTVGGDQLNAPGADQTASIVGMRLRVGYQSTWLGAGTVGYAPAGNPFTLMGGCNSDNAVITMNPGGHFNGMTVEATGCANGVVVKNADANHYMTNSTVFGADAGTDPANVNLSAGRLYVNELGLYGTETGVLISETGKLRGVEGTNGTLGYREGITPENENCMGEGAGQCDSVIAFENITSVDDPEIEVDFTIDYDDASTNEADIDQMFANLAELDTRLAGQAHIQGVSINAGGFDHGVYFGEAGSYYVTETLVQNANQSGSNNGAFNINNSNAIVYLSQSEISENRYSGISVVRGKLFAHKIWVDKNTVDSNFFGSAIKVAADQKLVISDSVISDNRRMGIYATHGQVFSENIEVYGSEYNVLSRYARAYVNISDSVIGNGEDRRFGIYVSEGTFFGDGLYINMNGGDAVSAREPVGGGNNGAFVSLKNSIINGANFGAHIGDNWDSQVNSASFENVLITGGGSTGIGVYGSATVDAVDVTIEDKYNGIAYLSNGESTFTRLTLDNGRNAGVLTGTENSDGTSTGILNLYESSINDWHVGIVATGGVTVNISDTIIAGNSAHGISAANGSTVNVLGRSTITNNGEYGIRSVEGCTRMMSEPTWISEPRSMSMRPARFPVIHWAITLKPNNLSSSMKAFRTLTRITMEILTTILSRKRETAISVKSS